MAQGFRRSYSRRAGSRARAPARPNTRSIIPETPLTDWTPGLCAPSRPACPANLANRTAATPQRTCNACALGCRSTRRRGSATTREANRQRRHRHPPAARSRTCTNQSRGGRNPQPRVRPRLRCRTHAYHRALKPKPIRCSGGVLSLMLSLRSRFRWSPV